MNNINSAALLSIQTMYKLFSFLLIFILGPSKARVDRASRGNPSWFADGIVKLTNSYAGSVQEKGSTVFSLRGDRKLLQDRSFNWPRGTF